MTKKKLSLFVKNQFGNPALPGSINNFIKLSIFKDLNNYCESNDCPKKSLTEIGQGVPEL